MEANDLERNGQFEPRGMVDRRSMLHLIREPAGINSNNAILIYCEIRDYIDSLNNI